MMVLPWLLSLKLAQRKTYTLLSQQDQMDTCAFPIPQRLSPQDRSFIIPACSKQSAVLFFTSGATLVTSRARLNIADGGGDLVDIFCRRSLQGHEVNAKYYLAIASTTVRAFRGKP